MTLGEVVKDSILIEKELFDINTEKIVSAEALVRWIHPEYGFISPDRFIPGLEETGLVSKLDMYVFSETSRFIKERSDNNQFIVPISTNLSWMDFYDTNMLDNLLVDLKQEGRPYGYVSYRDLICWNGREESFCA